MVDWLLRCYSFFKFSSIKETNLHWDGQLIKRVKYRFYFKHNMDRTSDFLTETRNWLKRSNKLTHIHVHVKPIFASLYEKSCHIYCPRPGSNWHTCFLINVRRRTPIELIFYTVLDIVSIFPQHELSKFANPVSRYGRSNVHYTFRVGFNCRCHSPYQQDFLT